MAWSCASLLADTCDPSATPRAPAHQMGLMYVYGCVHTEVHVHPHDRRWVPTPNMCWRMVRNVVKAVRDALVHAVCHSVHRCSSAVQFVIARRESIGSGKLCEFTYPVCCSAAPVDSCFTGSADTTLDCGTGSHTSSSRSRA